MTEDQNKPGCGEDSVRLFADLDTYIDDLKLNPADPERREMLIMTLHKAQDIFGYLPAIVQKHVAQKFSIPHVDVSGVISFYNYFTTTPKGKIKINVCLGTACYVNGAEKILADFEKTLGIKVGSCVLAPVVMINNKVFGKVKPGDAPAILEQYLVEESTEEVKVS
jgi:NADH:ubiquinone oxidoreductase subunit E